MAVSIKNIGLPYGSIDYSSYGTSTTTGSYNNLRPVIIKVKGYDVSINYINNDIILALTMINTLGWSFYKELINNKYTIPIEVKNQIEDIYIMSMRDEKIKNILK